MSSTLSQKSEDFDEDPVTSMLKKTGCIELHYKVQVLPSDSLTKPFFQAFTLFQECIAETQDWRKCQAVVSSFKECMKVYTDQQRKKYSN